MDIAAYGWDHPEWEGSFYPEDLPEDWRLDFYCNEFHAIVVPSSVWAGEHSAGPRQWASGLGEQTRVYLELPEQIPPERLAAVRKALSGRFAGLVAEARPQGVPVAAGAPVGIWGHGAPDVPPPAGVGWCWRAEDGVTRCSGGGVSVAWFGPEPVEPMLLRKTIEAIAGGGGEGGSLIVAGGAPPSLKLMRDARTIAAFLGI